MKKNWKKIGILVAAIMITAAVFTACGGGGNNQPPAGGAASGGEAEVTTTTAPEKPDPIGKYTAIQDFKDVMNSSMGEDAPFEITGELPGEFHLELKSDDSFSMELDGEKFAETFTEWFKKNGVALFESAFEQQGLSSEEIGSYLEMMGYDSMDAFVEEYSTMMSEEMADSMTEMKIEGTYKIDDNKITFTTEEGGFEPKSTTLNDDGTITMALDAGEMGEMELVFKK